MATELVILDCDGVLVDSERLAIEIEARLLTELGWPMTPDEVVRRFLGRAAGPVLAEIEARIGPDLARQFDEESTRQVHAAFERELTTVEGIEDLLDRLDAANIPTCIASSGSHAKLRRTLGLTGLDRRFEGRVFSAEDVAHGKPAPDLFLHAARSMGVEPDACVVIEDSPYGVHAAVAAGMRVFGYAGGLTPAEALEQAGAMVITDLASMPLP